MQLNVCIFFVMYICVIFKLRIYCIYLYIHVQCVFAVEEHCSDLLLSSQLAYVPQNSIIFLMLLFFPFRTPAATRNSKCIQISQQMLLLPQSVIKPKGFSSCVMLFFFLFSFKLESGEFDTKRNETKRNATRFFPPLTKRN